jgi:hypothetical protein
MLLESYFDD